ncbi:UNVERIFIED_CONTAM: Ubiquitin-conjugating enzyme E2 27 [Sesamum calycinum]|uniref:Ubiquitin-conjugating enzyme E2 27 n=1 Tax=Sesamum calycinum TaxID=2727403 RepID=A0AAW2LV93_9LAMI
MVDFARVQKELQECNRDFQVSGIKVMTKGESNLAHLLGTIPGPIGTPYEGGSFKIDITLPAFNEPDMLDRSAINVFKIALGATLGPISVLERRISNSL